MNRDKREPTNRLPADGDLSKAQTAAPDPNKVVLTEEQAARWLSLNRTARLVAAILNQAQLTLRFLSVEEDRINRELAAFKAEAKLGPGNWMLDEKTGTCTRIG